MDRWDVLLILGATYVAIVTLVRLMAGRRNELTKQLQKQIEASQAARGGPAAGAAEGAAGDGQSQSSDRRGVA
jgi:hypothetical protein